MQVMSLGMHRALAGGAFDQVRKAADEAQQVLLMIAVEPARRLFADFPAVSQAAAVKLAKNTGNARMGILNVVHGVVVGLRPARSRSKSRCWSCERMT